jgi:hypothetical protein
VSTFQYTLNEQVSPQAQNSFAVAVAMLLLAKSQSLMLS